MYCVNCGFKLDENYKFCSSCGSKRGKAEDAFKSKSSVVLLLKIVRYIFGTVFAVITIGGLISLSEPYDYMMTTVVFFLAILLLPSFEYLCKLVKREFSIVRRLFLGLGTFFVPTLFYEFIGGVIVPPVSALIFWIIMFIIPDLTDE